MPTEVPAPPDAAPDSALGGVIPFRGALGRSVARLGQRIVGGEWAPGEAIPTEAELGIALGVSRSVVREAIRILGAKGLVRSRTSDGTRVLPRTEWRLLDPDVMDWRIKAGNTRELLLDLLRVRAVIEPGLVREATLAVSPDAHARIRAAWAAKGAAFASPDPDLVSRRRRFIETDLEFHRAFLAASGSPLLDQLFNLIEAALTLLFDLQMRARGFEHGMVGIADGHALHAAVMAAYEARDADAAAAAMRVLLVHSRIDADQAFANAELG